MIKLENVTKVYWTKQGPRNVLSGINLQISKGDKVGILGRNGSGKSTLIRLLSGAESPTLGHVQRSMSVSWPLAFGGAFQGSLSGIDNLKFICRVYDVPIAPAIEFVEEFTELGKYLKEPVKKYSSGMRARLAFALSLAVDFDCFLIDEVISVGDAKFRSKCEAELFVARKDRAMIMVSHEMQNLELFCKKVFVLHEGKIIEFQNFNEAHNFYHGIVFGNINDGKN